MAQPEVEFEVDLETGPGTGPEAYPEASPEASPEAGPEASLAQHAALREGIGPASALVALGLCGVFAFQCLYATQPLLPMFQQVFHAGKSAVALTVSASTLGVAFAAPIVGLLAQRLSRKRVIVASIAALSVPTLLAATSHGLHALVFWRLLQGLILPGIFATTIAYVTEEWPPERVPAAMSFYICGTVTGGFIGRVIAGILADYYGWRAAFIVLGAVTLVGAGVVARLLPRERSRPSAHAHLSRGAADRFRLLSARKMLLVYAVGFNILFTLVAMFTYATFHLSAPPFHLSTTALSWIFSVYLAGLVVTPLAGISLGRIGLRQGLVMAAGLSVAGVLLTLVPQLWVVLAGLALCSSGVFVSQAAATSYLRVVAPAQVRTMAAGLYLSAYYLGGTAGGEVPSWVWNHAGRVGGWPACVLLVAALGCVTMAMAWWGWE
jgi:predicted MFS family arabinose efflux permease